MQNLIVQIETDKFCCLCVFEVENTESFNSLVRKHFALIAQNDSRIDSRFSLSVDKYRMFRL